MPQKADLLLNGRRKLFPDKLSVSAPTGAMWAVGPNEQESRARNLVQNLGNRTKQIQDTLALFHASEVDDR